MYPPKFRPGQHIQCFAFAAHSMQAICGSLQNDACSIAFRIASHSRICRRAGYRWIASIGRRISMAPKKRQLQHLLAGRSDVNENPPVCGPAQVGGGRRPPSIPPPRDPVTSTVVVPLCGRICAALARRFGMAAAGTGGAGGHSPPGHCTHRAARTEQRCGDLPAIAQRSHHCVLFPTFARVRGRIRSVKATASLCRRGPCNAK